MKITPLKKSDRLADEIRVELPVDNINATL